MLYAFLSHALLHPFASLFVSMGLIQQIGDKNEHQTPLFVRRIHRRIG